MRIHYFDNASIARMLAGGTPRHDLSPYSAAGKVPSMNLSSVRWKWRMRLS